MEWVDCIATLIDWDERRAILATVFDITEHKHAEQALRASDERFRQLAARVKEAFVIVDLPSGHTAYVSPPFEDIWQRKAADVYEDPELWFRMIHPHDQAQVRRHCTENREGRPTEGVFRVVREDGSVRWARYRMFPVVDPNGRASRIVGLVEDITDQRLQDEQFRQAQKMEALGQLAGGIAHDFNNLLTAMHGFAELALHDLGPSHRSSPDLNEILKAAQSAASLTRGILAFSRRQILQPRVIDLNQVLRQIDPLLRRLIGEDLSLVINTSPTLMRVYADPGQIEQIVMNLAVNARDAMPHGGRLTIETANAELDAEYVRRHPGASPGPQVLLAVSDTGIGITDEVKNHLFEPFFTTKGPGKGTGLGLATVYRSSSRVAAQSGSTANPGWDRRSRSICQSRPLRRAVPSLPTPAGRCCTRRQRDGAGRGRSREVRAIVNETLRRHGYTVLQTSSGAEAVATSGQYECIIQLLVTDVVLPEMHGRQVAQVIQSRRPDIRVLYTSGYADEVIVRHGILEEGVAFLQKPFSAEALVRKIREVLDAENPPAV